MASGSQDFKQRAVAAACDLFIEKGFEATSMGDVGTALAVSKPTIYEHFSSKHCWRL